MAYLNLANVCPPVALRGTGQQAAGASPIRQRDWSILATTMLALLALAIIGGLFALLAIKLENAGVALIITATLLLPLAPVLSRAGRA